MTDVWMCAVRGLNKDSDVCILTADGTSVNRSVQRDSTFQCVETARQQPFPLLPPFLLPNSMSLLSLSLPISPSQTLSSMLLVKALRAEPFESSLFRQLAESNRAAQLRKKREKVLFPEAITAAYSLAVVALFAVGAVAVRGQALTGGGIVSFFTSLVLLVEPIQVRRRLGEEI